MNRIWTLLGVLLAALAIVFHFASIGGGFLVPMVAIAIVLVGVGVMTGQ